MSARLIRTSTVATLLGALVLTGCSAPTPAPAPSPTVAAPAPTASPDDLPATPTDIATGLDAPWSITFLGEIPLVSERDSGRILEVAPDGTTREVGTIAEVTAGGEGGLLGLATADDQLYSYFTAADGNRIERFDLDGPAGSLTLGAPQTVLDGLPSSSTHNGGRIAFGPDGMLYVGTGDAGQPDRAQDPDSLGGKILRMTPDGDAPDDNPTSGSLVYTLGHRNVQGLAWSPDGTLFASEFGQNTWDELNIIEPGGNYGWPAVEGQGGDAAFIDPVHQWTPDGIAVAGNTVIMASLRGERLTAIPATSPGSSSDYYVGEFGRLRDAVVAPDGSVWFLTNNTDGRGDARADDDRIIRVELTDEGALP
ncbi:MAG: PQQ-dependent sugar dehydrogenase [Actinomycetota bacterium]